MPDKKKTKKISFPLMGMLGLVTIFLVWLILSLTLTSGGFPSIFDTFKMIGVLFTEDDILVHIGYTLLRLLIIFIITFLISAILGVIAGISKPFKDFLNPLIIILRTIPTAAIIIVIILLLEPNPSMFLVTFIMMFPILYEAIASGIINIDDSILNALRVDGGIRNPRTIFKVLIPLSMPYTALGITQSLGLGIKALIMAEIFVGDTRMHGLGFLLNHYRIETNIEGALAVGIIAILLCGIIDIAFHFIKKKLNLK